MAPSVKAQESSSVSHVEANQLYVPFVSRTVPGAVFKWCGRIEYTSGILKYNDNEVGYFEQFIMCTCRVHVASISQPPWEHVCQVCYDQYV